MSTDRTDSFEERLRYLNSADRGPFHVARKVFKKGFALVRAPSDPRSPVYIFDNDSSYTRGRSMARVLSRCGALPEARWFVVNLRDLPQVKPPKFGLPLFGSACADGYCDIEAPDYTFGGWREIGGHDFDSTCREISQAGESKSITDKLGWYGAVWSHPNRARLLEIGRQFPDRMEIVDLQYFGRAGVRAAPGVGLTMKEQVERFQYLIDVEGIGYSGRLKYLLHSGRPILIQDRPWREWYFSQLQPWTHFAPVRRDLADLPFVLDRLDADPALRARIGEASRAFAAKHLTAAAATAKWTALLSGEDEACPWRKAWAKDERGKASSSGREAPVAAKSVSRCANASERGDYGEFDAAPPLA